MKASRRRRKVPVIRRYDFFVDSHKQNIVKVEKERK